MILWILQQIKSLLVQLNSKDSIQSLSLGLACGYFLGLLPMTIFLYAVIFFMILLFKINLPFVFLSFGIHTFLGIILSSFFHELGLYFLTEVNVIVRLMTDLMNRPLFPFFNLNNTVSMGAFIFGLATSYFVYIFYFF